MLFMHNETGELYEMLICSLDDSNPEIEDADMKWRVGTIALLGEVNPGIRHINQFIKEMTLIGFI